MIYCVNTYNYNKIFNNTTHNVKEIPDGKNIWAFAYREDERALNLLCKPVKGRIIDNYFYEYKVNGKDLKKNGVSVYARFYTDTYEEAVDGFNQLVSERIKRLKDEISKLEDMLIINNKTV